MNEIMQTRYRLICRGSRGGKFYCVDTLTGKRTSLHTANQDNAQQIVEAKNNSERQPVLNLQIAKAYLAGSDNGIAKSPNRNAAPVAESFLNCYAIHFENCFEGKLRFQLLRVLWPHGPIRHRPLQLGNCNGDRLEFDCILTLFSL